MTRGRGRPRKPIEHLKLHGTFRTDRHGDDATAWTPEGIPAKPAGLPQDANTLWDFLTDQSAAVLTPVDAPQLQALCEWWARYRQVSEAMNTLPGPGHKDWYRLQILAGTAWKNFDTLAARFGLTPSDRTRVRTNQPQTPQGSLAAFAARK